MQIAAFVDALKRQGLRSGAGVPCSDFTPLVNSMTVDPELDYLAATSEGEAVAIAAGLTAAGRPAFALMQNSGLGNAVNPITSLLYSYQIPVMLLVSHRGGPGKPDEPQHELMGRITEELARLVSLRTARLDPERFEGELAAALADGVPAAWVVPRDSLEGGPKVPPREWQARSGPVSPAPSAASFRPQATREAALDALLPLFNRGLEAGAAPAVISTTGKLSRELYELDDRDHARRNRFYMVGSMGCAAGFGLGVARGLPSRQVLVLDGDGALLMKLGSLATIGHAAPANLRHLVFDNAAYESTGCQPTSSPTVDFATLALACGYRAAETVAAPEELAPALERQLALPGPTLLRLVIGTGSRKDLGRPKLRPREGWLRFCAYLRGGQ